MSLTRCKLENTVYTANAPYRLLHVLQLVIKTQTVSFLFKVQLVRRYIWQDCWWKNYCHRSLSLYGKQSCATLATVFDSAACHNVAVSKHV